MFSEDPKVKAQRRKAKWMMALICGPVFAVSFLVLFSAVMALSVCPWVGADRLYGIEGYRIHIAGAGALAALFFVGDPLSKRWRISAMDYSGPVAFSCVLFGLLGLLAASFLGEIF